MQVPGTDVLQVFYHGDDNTVWTLWRNPADGGWSNAQSLGGQTLYWDEYGSSSPVAIQVPGTDVLQVFYRGKYDNHLWTRWRNTDGIWSPEENLGGLLNSDPAVAQVPGTNLLQVFYQGQDGALWTRWRNTNGTWSNEQSLGGHLFVPTCADPTNDTCYGKYATPVAIQLPNTNALEVFYRGSDNTLRGFLRNQDGTWTPQYFGGETQQRSLSGAGTGHEPNRSLLPGSGGTGWVLDNPMGKPGPRLLDLQYANGGEVIRLLVL